MYEFSSYSVVHDGLQRGDLSRARRLYEHIICIPDLLPLLASHGLLVEVRFPAQLMKQLQAEEAADATREDATRDAAHATPEPTGDADGLSIRAAVSQAFPASSEADVRGAAPDAAAVGSASAEASFPPTALPHAHSRLLQYAHELHELARQDDRSALRERLQSLGVTTVGQRLKVQQWLLTRP